MRTGIILRSVWALLLFLPACHEDSSGDKEASNNITGSLEAVLKKHSVDSWYPRVLDTLNGGYLSDFAYDWQLDGPQHKMVVSQARHIWTCSKLAEFYGDRQYGAYARHGYEFLKDKMWDIQHGGFYTLVDGEGNFLKREEGWYQKNAYGNAFAIYGLAAYYKLSRDQQALNLAIDAFNWLEAHSHDSLYGGYFQFLAKDGSPYLSGYDDVPPKDQNSSIHLLEAFTELYQVWPDPLLRKRLEEMLIIIMDTITTEVGYMNLFFQRNWSPFTYEGQLDRGRDEHFNLDHVSFGHDIETAYLLLEAAESIGLDDDSITMNRTKKMVDHTLDHGWDEVTGGIYDRGYYFDSLNAITIIDHSKVWWAQAEALNSLHMMSVLYPNDRMNYYRKFEKQWDYIQQFLIDHEHGGWFGGGIDQEPHQKVSAKGQIWKVNYHTVRSLMNCINRLKETDKVSHH